MRRVWIVGLASLCGVMTLAGTTGCSRSTGPPAGAVIVRCEPGWAGARAGLRPGDVVAGWRRGERDGEISSPFELARVEQEEAPFGAVVLLLRGRGPLHREVSMPLGFWRVEARPVLSAKLLARHQAALRTAGEGRFEKAAFRWKELAGGFERAGLTEAAAWSRLRAGAALIREGEAHDGQRELEAGAALLDGPAPRAVYWERAGRLLLFEARRRGEAARAFTESLDLRKRETPGSPAVAFTLIQLCRTSQRAHLKEAQEAVAIYRSLTGDGMETASALYQLALSEAANGPLEAAETHFREGLAIAQELADESALHVDLLGHLGRTMCRAGECEAGRRYLEQAMDMVDRFAPQSLQAAYIRNLLGLVNKSLGDLAVARLWYLRALAIFREQRPGGVEVAGMLNNLGNVAMKEDDLAGALQFHREALAIRERLHPNGKDVAASLNNVGMVERQMGDLANARKHLERALELKRKIVPGSWTLGNTLTELGMTASEEERYAEAARLYAEALAIRKRIAPGNPMVADLIFLQGSLAGHLGHLKQCEGRYRRAIAMAERQQDGLALSGHELSRFGARFYTFYGALARHLVEQGRDEEAFAIMERARARALRSMLFGARSVPAGVPGRLWASYNRVLRKIERYRTEQAQSAAAGSDAAEIADLGERIGRLKAQRDRLAQRIAAAAPRLASFGNVPSPTLEDVCRALDPGTLLLSYLAGKERTVLFVMSVPSAGGCPLRTFSIPVGSAELDRRANILRAFIARGRIAPTVDGALVAQGRKLFQLLVAPAGTEIETAQRILIIPDGPLLDLPFAALVLPGEPVRFLGVWKPLFFNPSAGAFMALKARRKDPRPGPGIVAFGDPDYPPGSRTVRDLHLKPLDGARCEVRRIAAHFGHRARLFLGNDVSEERIRSLQSYPRYLHFAVHARSDARFPLESALYLSLPAATGVPQDRDGVLHAWEIMDRLHLGAEVVTLSGCSTGCGEEVAGEGLFGLARAFQYAGARTLVASQWPVADHTTCELMDRFYEGLVEGLGTAEALWKAQRALAEAPLSLDDGGTLDARHPFDWAAFQVIGDWR